jgi:hypothetical protein
LILIKHCFTIDENKGGFMSEKNVFKGVKITESQSLILQQIADKKFEGNFSMAIRFVIDHFVKHGFSHVEN